jgi:hypothetical protein
MVEFASHPGNERIKESEGRCPRVLKDQEEIRFIVIPSAIRESHFVAPLHIRRCPGHDRVTVSGGR